MYIGRLILTLFFLIGSSATAATVNALVTTDSPTKLVIVGGSSAVTNSIARFKTTITKSGYWLINNFIIEEDADFTDELFFSGLIQHLKSPPGHSDGAGDPILFNWSLKADKIAGFNKWTTIEAHGPHQDHFEIRANGPTTGILFKDFKSYNYTIVVDHWGDPPVPDPTTEPYEVEPIPLPASLPLIAAAALLLGVVGRKRREAAVA